MSPFRVMRRVGCSVLKLLINFKRFELRWCSAWTLIIFLNFVVGCPFENVQHSRVSHTISIPFQRRVTSADDKYSLDIEQNFR